MIREAAPADIPAMEAFLSRHPETSMFLRSNIAAQGVGQTEHPYSGDYLIWPAEGPIRAIFGISGRGFLMLQCPGQEREAFDAAAAHFAGRHMRGLTGEAGQARAYLDALGLTAQIERNEVEPLYSLDLADLPEVPGKLRAPEPGDEALLTRWFRAYIADTGLAPADPGEAQEEAERRARDVIAGSPPCRLMIEDGQPVAMAALNAEVADVVQVGGVYVPRETRNRGLGRRVTALLLAQARESGARLALLFAANPAAARAYEGIGFRRIGDYRVAMPDRVLTIPGGVSA
ncbi:Acetyltransferase (GNAT) family protein [Pseudooceanicola antarcticus]|uniref:Acetyltransferase (GNAT) family protein n=1 Tax=Pseudooceanicola antarcticus TaxID=1247613 RepID=A0A285IR26_9RHOB|nr:GNAT family N-acetyltransferase [Pseudooceanicola antarcticus]PJE31801.1 GNAT family N-acetyltransferase [Pseudooceanicola antarcticus]SNY50422.1 Acetyltransferase (GNAT) family protein [Pseudooceanicola antarcticus]